jgi:hypothetical protein
MTPGASGTELGGFSYRGEDGLDIGAFGQWTEFDYSSESVPAAQALWGSVIAYMSLSGQVFSISRVC